MQVDHALETEVLQRAADLLDASVDINRLGFSLRRLAAHVTSVRDSVHTHKQQLHCEVRSVTRLSRRKQHLMELKKVRICQMYSLEASIADANAV